MRIKEDLDYNSAELDNLDETDLKKLQVKALCEIAKELKNVNDNLDSIFLQLRVMSSRD